MGAVRPAKQAAGPWPVPRQKTAMSDNKLKPGIFAFLKAAESGDAEAVKKFLEDGGDIHASDDGHNTALHLVMAAYLEFWI